MSSVESLSRASAARNDTARAARRQAMVNLARERQAQGLARSGRLRKSEAAALYNTRIDSSGRVVRTEKSSLELLASAQRRATAGRGSPTGPATPAAKRKVRVVKGMVKVDPSAATEDPDPSTPYGSHVAFCRAAGVDPTPRVDWVAELAATKKAMESEFREEIQDFDIFDLLDEEEDVERQGGVKHMKTLSDFVDARQSKREALPTLSDMIAGFESDKDEYLMNLITNGKFAPDQLAFWVPLLPKIVAEKERRAREAARLGHSRYGSLSTPRSSGRFQGSRRATGSNIASISDYEIDTKQLPSHWIPKSLPDIMEKAAKYGKPPVIQLLKNLGYPSAQIEEIDLLLTVILRRAASSRSQSRNTTPQSRITTSASSRPTSGRRGLDKTPRRVTNTPRSPGYVLGGGGATAATPKAQGNSPGGTLASGGASKPRSRNLRGRSHLVGGLGSGVVSPATSKATPKPKPKPNTPPVKAAADDDKITDSETLKISRGAEEGTAQDQAKVAGNDSVEAKTVVLDDSKATATLMLVLHPRARLRQKFNVDHTVADVYAHVAAVSKAQGPFDLVSGFPPKPLPLSRRTVAQAGLKGAVLTQRMRK